MFTEKILYAQGGHLYVGNQTDGFTMVDESGITAPAYGMGNELSIVQAGRYWWIVDGVNALRRVNIDTAVLDEPGPTTAAAIPTNARLLALYRGRLFHARIGTDPYNYYASFSGDFLNYDASDDTQDGSFAGNNTQQAGLLGDILTAMIPYGDVSMVMGMSNSIAVMRGDPKAGGSIDTLSREIGIVRPNAWARSPDGSLFFMARDGLYKISGEATSRLDLYGGIASATPAAISRGRLDETLGAINHNTTKVMMSWDPGEQGLKIYLMPLDNTQPTISVFWEQRKDAYWRDVIAPGVGPTACALVNAPDQQFVLLGCWDGFLRQLSPTALSDDGAAITSFVDYPPQQFQGPMVDAKIVQSRYLFADNGSNFAASYSLRVANDPVTALNATTSYQQFLSEGGYEGLDRHRQRGACAILRISNNQLNKAWAIEKTTLMVAPSGRVRQ